MKQLSRLFLIFVFSVLCLGAGAQPNENSVLRAGLNVSLPYFDGTAFFLEYGYRVAPCITTAIKIEEESAWKGPESWTVSSVALLGYYRPWINKDFWRRLEAGVGLGYGRIFRAYEEHAGNYSDKEYRQVTHHAVRLEVPIRYYIFDTGKIALATEVGGVWHYKRDLTFYGFRLGLNLAVSF